MNLDYSTFARVVGTDFQPDGLHEFAAKSNIGYTLRVWMPKEIDVSDATRMLRGIVTEITSNVPAIMPPTHASKMLELQFQSILSEKEVIESLTSLIGQTSFLRTNVQGRVPNEGTEKLLSRVKELEEELVLAKSRINELESRAKANEGRGELQSLPKEELLALRRLQRRGREKVLDKMSVKYTSYHGNLDSLVLRGLVRKKGLASKHYELTEEGEAILAT